MTGYNKKLLLQVIAPVIMVVLSVGVIVSVYLYLTAPMVPDKKITFIDPSIIKASKLNDSAVVLVVIPEIAIGHIVKNDTIVVEYVHESGMLELCTVCGGASDVPQTFKVVVK